MRWMENFQKSNKRGGFYNSDTPRKGVSMCLQIRELRRRDEGFLSQNLVMYYVNVKRDRYLHNEDHKYLSILPMKFLKYNILQYKNCRRRRRKF